MKEIYFVTSNNRKFKSLSTTLLKFGIKVKRLDVELIEPQSHDIREIAIEKARQALKKTGKPCVVQDSGFYVSDLHGFPGTLMKFVLQTIGINGILKLAEGNDRECYFKNCLAYIEPGSKEPLCFENTVVGTLSEKPKGRMDKKCWTELFLVFIPNGESKSLAQMSTTEYSKWYDTVGRSYEIEFAKYIIRK